jgi:hypothetical protein
VGGVLGRGVSVLGVVVVAVIADQPDVNAYQQRKDEGLDEADEQFEKVEWEWQAPFLDAAHRMQEILAAKHVAEEAE